MNRISAIGKALEIVGTARKGVLEDCPAAWDFLSRVTRYLASEQRAAFAEYFEVDAQSANDQAPTRALAVATAVNVGSYVDSTAA